MSQDLLILRINIEFSDQQRAKCILCSGVGSKFKVEEGGTRLIRNHDNEKTDCGYSYV